MGHHCAAHTNAFLRSIQMEHGRKRLDFVEFLVRKGMFSIWLDSHAASILNGRSVCVFVCVQF